MHWTQQEYDEYLKSHGKPTSKPKGNKKPQKYNNNGTWYDGVYFRSQLELQRYCQLKLLLNAGEIARITT